ncbi:MAG: exonuclease domain-containing protein [Chloroflexi bacterium]|nr:exonuclease domain-containing protein [Chloroflexota bacterium]MDA1147576.1 exonuclease domain-containing protein [Chloroflexota bacterium]
MSQQFVALDLETTGLNPEVDEITEIGATRFDRDGGSEQFHTFVNPGRSIPMEIQQLTGITDADVADAPRFERVVNELATFVGNCPVVGQNIKFDLGFLSSAGLDLPGPIYDTWEIASVLLPRADHLNLASIAELLNVPLRQAHRALEDAETTRDIFLALLARFEELPRSLLGELHDFAAAARWSAATLIAEAILRAPAEPVIDDAEAAAIVERLRQPQPPEVIAPLVPSDKPVTVAGDEVAAVFDAASRRADLFADYEPRPGQVEMARQVAQQLAHGGSYAIEAGTGTGKSLGYLVPALLHASRNHDRVVVSTHTINLQEQLAHHDVPLAASLIEAATGEPASQLRASVLKGRTNYLCLDLWTQARLEARPRNEPEARLYGRIANWLPSTSTGDVAELYMTSDEQPAWSRLSADGTDCLSRRCSFVRDGSCFVLRARQRAAGSHVVIVNHALLLANASRSDQLLPPFRHLVIDEAHRLEDVATQHFGASFGVRDARELFDRAGSNERHGAVGLARLLRQGELAAPTAALSPVAGFSALADQIEPAVTGGRDALRAFTDTLRDFARDQFEDDRARNRTELPLTKGVRSQPQWEDVEETAIQLEISLQVLSSRLGSVADTIGSVPDSIPDARTIGPLALGLRTQTEELRGVLNHAVLSPTRDDVSWLVLGEGDVRINLAPLDVAPRLQSELFDGRESILATSATLQTSGSFDFSLRRLGLDEAETLVVPSPFDYRRAVLTLVVDDLPEPGMPGYEFALHELLADAALAAGGRTLALFTSHAALRAAANDLREDLAPRNVRVLAQRIDGSPARLLRMLQEQPNSMILGTAAFWEGVDVPGEALSQIVIARLPFPVPTDPVYAGRAERFQDPFSEYALPQSVLRFRQGFGRLIRRTTDRGVFLIADSRVARRDYGKAFLQGLPDTELRTLKAGAVADAVADWLNR